MGLEILPWESGNEEHYDVFTITSEQKWILKIPHPTSALDERYILLVKGRTVSWMLSRI